MKILALDLSLTRTGVARCDGVRVLVPPKDLRGMERLLYLEEAILERAADAELVVLEGYSFGSRGRAVVDIGELGGVIRLALYRRGIRFVDVPPATLKRYATGKGNASKEEVLAAAIRRLGYAGHDHNESDAMWLYAMAQDRYLGVSRVPSAHRAALDAVAWP